MSYSLSDYGRMLQDGVRRDAYLQVIKKYAAGARVLDLGCGTGYFSMHAAQAGASHVVAIDTNEHVKLLPEVLKQNGMSDKVEAVHGDIRDFNFGQFDLILADLRGPTPFFGHGLDVMSYARTKLLTDGGVLTPASDTLNAALVNAPDWYASVIEPWRLGSLDWSIYEKRLLSTPVQIASLTESALMSTHFEWAMLDYSNASSLDKKQYGGNSSVSISKDGLCHGIVCWFETQILEGIGYTTAASNHKPTYGRFLLPFQKPVPCSASMDVSVSVRCNRVMDSWVWEWSMDSGQQLIKCSSLDTILPLPKLIRRE